MGFSEPEKFVALANRYPIRLPLTLPIYFSHEGKKIKASSLSVFPTEIHIECDSAIPLEEGDLLELGFSMLDSPVELRGCVLYLTPKASRLTVGIQILDFSAGEAIWLERFQQLAKEQSFLNLPGEAAPWRLATGIAVSWGATPLCEKSGLIVNLSLSGAFISTSEPLPPERQLFLSFLLPGQDEELRMMAVVARNPEPESPEFNLYGNGMGVTFRQTSLESDQLSHFFQSHAQSQSTLPVDSLQES